MPNHALAVTQTEPLIEPSSESDPTASPAQMESDNWTDLVFHQLLIPLTDYLNARQRDGNQVTQYWARTLAEAGCQSHELGGIRQALLSRPTDTRHAALQPAHAVEIMHRLRHNGQALAAMPRRGVRYPQQTRQRRLASLYAHLSARARQQNTALFTEQRGKLWRRRISQALDQSARRIAEQETLILDIDPTTPTPDADAVDAVLLSDGWHFSIRSEKLADWRQRLPRLV